MARTKVSKSRKKPAEVLPQGTSTWMGLRTPLPLAVEEHPEGADVAIWLDVDTEYVLASRIAPKGSPGLLRETLLEAMHSPAAPSKPGRPRAVAVEQEEWFAELEDVIEQHGVARAAQEDFSLLHDLVEAFVEAPRRSVPTPELTGIDPAAQGLFCERMAALWEAAPWRQVSEGQMLSVEGLAPEPLFLAVMGQKGHVHGLAVFLTEAAAATIQQVEGTSMEDLPCLVASFESEDMVGPEWPALVRAHQWKQAPEDLFPAVVRLGSRHFIPTEDEMHLLSVLVAVVTDYPFGDGRPGYLEFTMEGKHGLACWPALPEMRRKSATRAPRPPRPGACPKKKSPKQPLPGA